MPPNEKLVLHGTDLSQPCRSVSWLLRIKGKEFDYQTVMPGSKSGTRDKNFQKDLNRDAKVPVLQHGDVVVSESNAILVYLCEVFNWNDLYPTGGSRADAAQRARINKWLHWHHLNSREYTIGLFAPLMRPDIKFPPETIEMKRKHVIHVTKLLDDALATSKFLAGDSPTIADIAVYADLGQCSARHLNLFDFTPYPHVVAWMDRMTKLPKYEETHETLDGIKSLVQDAQKKKQSASNKIQAKM